MNRYLNRLLFCLLLSVPVLASTAQETSTTGDPFAAWRPAIREFEAQDEQHPPPQGETLFVGSSSIRLWDLSKSFPHRELINRGFGGSQIADSIHFADRIILEHKPRIIVLYAGDNDINAGKTPQRVAIDFAELVRVVHNDLPDTQVGFVAIKPSISRWQLVEKMREANSLIRNLCESNAKLTYLDIDSPMIGADGRPKGELFDGDGLHLNEKGYEVWTTVVERFLQQQATKAK